MRLQQAPLVIVLGVCLTLRTSALKHETVVISNNQTEGRELVVSGATIMSEEFYQDKDSISTVILVPYCSQPELTGCRFIVQLVYIDLPRHEPCQDYVEICKLVQPSECTPLQPQTEQRPFCGDLDYMFHSVFKPKGHDYLWTRTSSSIKIVFRTKNPAGTYRGFKFIVTAVSMRDGCQSGSHFQCEDSLCISIDLHCDGIAHCLDGTDEINNCTRKVLSNSEGLVPITYCGPHDQNPVCRDRRWGERWFGLAIPMAIVMVLLFFAIAVKVRKQLCHPMPMAGSGRLHIPRRRERAVQAPPIPQRPVIGPGWICPHEHFNDPTLPPPEIDVGFADAATLMLLPPPYSPPEDRPANPYDPPTEGEPPPLYEDSLHHELHSEKAVIVPGPPGPAHTPGGTTVHRPHPPAYQVSPPVTTSLSTSTAASTSSCCPSTLVVMSTGEVSLVPSTGVVTATQRGLIPVTARTQTAIPALPHSPYAEFSL